MVPIAKMRNHSTAAVPWMLRMTTAVVRGCVVGGVVVRGVTCGLWIVNRTLCVDFVDPGG